ncbi:uncharacterized protein LAESUDRAFT_735745 [Laetiporus sulphureus 93-53]|uniref:RNA polymerase II subunit A C-terminal domain phosphatase n=1 Tax=Laetiporus sulphureus 93-53 TaxID=1314785 RepID=A0A165F7R2_9APHY|nr:uncharacterized protein LAESUDRAFT_735745 [Laetiporus sulphureus 93-53]KZT08553.1 hypothetical protein LAESUDRAFT_735745 [Laetiporus sulphureus 93-53]
MSAPTELFLPPELPYPIKITAHFVDTADTVSRGTRLLDYSYNHVGPDGRAEVRYGTWDSSIEGSVEKWGFKTGEVVSARKAREIPAVYITEPCKHSVQLGGLCCLCGKDMTVYDYTGFSDTTRASIQMTHLANGPTVSLEEAQRIEQETAEHLLKSRKLSLIVDLDQTIVHATVDPTVGEWIAEGEAWEARQAKKAAEAQKNEESAEEMSTDTDDEVNPNWEALKDVKRFRLGPEALGQPSLRGFRGKGKEKAIEMEGCMYYIKPRPGWKEFLEAMATKYEMHVYTMGTRAYAEEVCAAIDPEGKMFGGRLLSRDESGSLTQKSLQRLFPCDQSMVVIIDDRADVWEWSPNLVKVIPYDFFVGIGDINSAFLPKLDALTTTPPAGPSIVTHTTEQPSTVPPTQQPEKEPTPSPSPTPTPPPQTPPVASSLPVEGLSAEEIAKNEILMQNTIALEAQVEERPLAKKQEELQEASAAASDETEETGETTTAAAAGGPVTVTAGQHKKEKAPRKALLKNDDRELERVQKILEEVHQRFYDEYDARPPDHRKGAKIKPKKRTEHVPYDVRLIIPRMRMDVLDGVHILFSSVIPLDTRPEATEIWKTAHAFGAQCYAELSNRVTHVVAAKRGTQKVDAARRQGGIKIVWLSWFTDSVALWQRQDETPYLLEPGTPPQASAASPPSDAHQISSDAEPGADEWGETPAGGLELDEVDWQEVNDEVEAAMNESDEDGASEQGGTRSGNASEDEGSWTEESMSVVSPTSSPKEKRKRLRSQTPSDSSEQNGALSADTDELRSQLAKRRKIAAERSGTSKLKEAITAADLVGEDAEQKDAENEAAERATTPDNTNTDSSDSSDDESDDESDEAMDEEDWLAGEMEEEMG